MPTLSSTNSTPGDTVPSAGEHVVLRLLDTLAAGAVPPTLSPAEFTQAARHLATCASCHAAASIVLSALSWHDLDALLVHVVPSEAPSDEDLAYYAVLVADGDAAAAARMLPTVAAHVAECARCQDSIAETRSMVAGPPPVDPVDIVPIDVRAFAFPGWQNMGTHIHRLLEPCHVWVRSMSVRITSILAGVHITTDYVASGSFMGEARGSSADTTDAAVGVTQPSAQPTHQEQSFTVDLCDDPNTAPAPWVQVRVSLRALHSLRVTAQITTTLVASPDAHEDAREVKPGIEWQLVAAHTDPAMPPLRSGVTDARGISRFYVDDRCEYTLTFFADDSKWSVPLSIHLEDDSTPGSDRLMRP